MQLKITKILSVLCMYFLLGSVAQANICIEINLPTSSKYTFDHFKINSGDGTRIAGNLFTPKSSPGPSGYPVIVFVNSWGLDEHEYIVQAAQFAKKGYMVLSYSSRGWGCSGGQAQVVGPKDIEDLTAIVNYLEANPNVDMNNVGISGISYGSGISLMGLALESRIKTAVAMSTWGSATESLYGQETPRLFWGFFLLASGYLAGTMDPIIKENYNNLIFHRNIDETVAWAEERSPVNVIDLINQRNAPVYVANNFGDNLFQPNSLMKYFEQLTGPKRMDLNQGTHASGEGLGLLGLDNYTWNNTHDWFDYHLKGIDNGIMDRPPVTMLTDLSTTRDEYSDYPIPEAHEKNYFFSPRGFFKEAKLTDTPYSSWWPKTNTILSGLDSGATTGIPALSALLDGNLRVPVKAWIPLLNQINGIVYQTDKLDDKLKVRGIPNVKVNVTPSKSKMQLVAYLYDVDSFGIGKLITHGTISLHDADPKRRVEIDMELVATAYDVPAGHRVALAFDTFDLLYAVPTIAPYKVDFNHSRSYNSVLSLPVVD